MRGYDKSGMYIGEIDMRCYPPFSAGGMFHFPLNTLYRLNEYKGAAISPPPYFFSIELYPYSVIALLTAHTPLMAQFYAL